MLTWRAARCANAQGQLGGVYEHQPDLLCTHLARHSLHVAPVKVYMREFPKPRNPKLELHWPGTGSNGWVRGLKSLLPPCKRIRHGSCGCGTAPSAGAPLLWAGSSPFTCGLARCWQWFGHVGCSELGRAQLGCCILANACMVQHQLNTALHAIPCGMQGTPHFLSKSMCQGRGVARQSNTLHYK